MESVSALTLRPAVFGLRWRITPLRLILGALLLAAAVRVVGLGERPLWLDESYSAWFASRGWHELWTAVPTYEPHPPFYYSLLKVWRDVFGGTPVALRAFSILFALLTIPVMVAASLEQERQSPSGRPMLRAGIAAFLAASSPMLVFLDQEARPYPLMIFAYALATLALLRLVREFRDGAGQWSSWLMLGAGAELALWAHAIGILYVLCLAAALLPAWLARPFPGKRLRRGFAVAALVAALYAPCLVMIMKRAADWGSGWLSWKPSMIFQLLSLYTVPTDVLTIGSAVGALAMLLLIKRALEQGSRMPGWNDERALLLLWWGPPILAVLISSLFVPIFLLRALAATLAPAYLAMAGALARTDRRSERLVISAMLLLTLVPTALQVALRPAQEPWDNVRDYLERHVAPGDQVWLYPNDSALPLREAGLSGIAVRGLPGDYPAVGFKGPIRAGSPAVVSMNRAQTMAAAGDAALKSVPTIWLVTRQRGIFDPQGDMPFALSRVRRAGAPHDWSYIEVTPYYAR